MVVFAKKKMGRLKQESLKMVVGMDGILGANHLYRVVEEPSIIPLVVPGEEIDLICLFVGVITNYGINGLTIKALHMTGKAVVADYLLAQQRLL